MSVRLIGLCGFKQCGKSTASKALVSDGFHKLSFAGPLKGMLAALGLTEAQLNGDQKEVPCDLLGGKTPRWAMQSLGTEWGRECIDEHIWTRAFISQARRHLLAGTSVVCDDVRFPNEVHAIQQAGGKVIRILRDGCETSNHESEFHIPSLKVDAYFLNNGSVQVMHQKLFNVIDGK